MTDTPSTSLSAIIAVPLECGEPRRHCIRLLTIPRAGVRLGISLADMFEVDCLNRLARMDGVTREHRTPVETRYSK